MNIAGLELEYDGKLKLEVYLKSPKKFPALVQVECPTDVWQNSGPEQYQCGLSLQCFKEEPYFTPQILHVRLAFSFAFAHNSSQWDEASPFLRRRCAIWKSGIQWLDQDGVETIVKKCGLMSCLEGEELVGVQLRSLLIPNIMEAKEELCPKISTNNLMMDPSNLTSYPLPELSHESLLSSVISKWFSGE